MHLRDACTRSYAELIYNGFWFSPEREALQAAIDKTSANVNGTVRVKLYKGNVIVVGRKAANSLYNANLSTFEDDGGAYDQKDAAGFIKIQALRAAHARQPARCPGHVRDEVVVFELMRRGVVPRSRREGDPREVKRNWSGTRRRSFGRWSQAQKRDRRSRRLVDAPLSDPQVHTTPRDDDDDDITLVYRDVRGARCDRGVRCRGAPLRGRVLRAPR